MSTRKGDETLHRTRLSAKNVRFGQTHAATISSRCASSRRGLRPAWRGRRGSSRARAARLASPARFARAGAGRPRLRARGLRERGARARGGERAEPAASGSGTSRAASRSADRSTTSRTAPTPAPTTRASSACATAPNLQLDLDLPRDWKARAEGWGFYDAAYMINGRSDYSHQVRREYEQDAEVGEAWLAGGVGEHIDVAVGRQVVIWGRSESLRVLDVLNPLDNREPGPRRSRGHPAPGLDAEREGLCGRLVGGADRDPGDPLRLEPGGGQRLLPGHLRAARAAPAPLRGHSSSRARSTGSSAAGTSRSTARGSGTTPPRLDDALVPRLVHDRLWMVGSGGNYTLGSWLFKAELAYLDGLGFFGRERQEPLRRAAGRRVLRPHRHHVRRRGGRAPPVRPRARAAARAELHARGRAGDRAAPHAQLLERHAPRDAGGDRARSGTRATARSRASTSTTTCSTRSRSASACCCTSRATCRRSTRGPTTTA